MESLINNLQSTNINFETSLIRLFISFIAGAIVGFEREIHHQPAGLRTHALICISSTLAMLLSIYIPQTFINFQNGDPGRIAAQVLSGIGFLGAGVILKHGVNIRGLTTAASVWSVAVIGLAIGAGMFLPAFAALIVILFVLIFMELLEKKIFKQYTYKTILISSTNFDDLSTYEKVISNHNLSVFGKSIEFDSIGGVASYSFFVKMPFEINLKILNEELLASSGIVSFAIKNYQMQ